MYDIVVIGHLLKETIVFPDGRKLGPLLGGPAAYSSAAAGMLGLRVGLVTKIGTDMPGKLLKVFKETGVDTKGVRTGKNTTTNRLIYDKTGSKKLEFLNRAEDIFFEDICEEYLNAQFFLIAAVNYEVSEKLIEELYKNGKKLSMELSGFGGASSVGKTKEEKLKILARITHYFEIVKGGREDYGHIFGDTPKVEENARKFIDWGAKVSLTTMGEEGGIITTKEGCVRIPSVPAKVVDLTGAGDVWHVGFLCAYLKNGQSSEYLKESAMFASALASLVIEKTGGVTKERFPSYEQVNQRFRFTGILQEK